jgi:hypothetical protein
VQAVAQLALCWAVLGVAGAEAQVASARLTGIVRDATGAPLAGAAVAVTAVRTGAISKVTTNAEGLYVAPGLPPGEYRISVEAPGFQTIVRERVPLSTGETIRLDVVLQPAGTAESVTVTADVPVLRTETGSLGQVISGAQIAHLPLAGRTFISLAALAPASRCRRRRCCADQRRPAPHDGLLRQHLGAAARARPGGVLRSWTRSRSSDREQSRPPNSAANGVINLHAGRIERRPGDRVRVLPAEKQRAQLFRAPSRSRRSATNSSAASLAADQAESDVLLRRLPGAASDDRPDRDVERPDRPAASGRLHRSGRRARRRHLRSAHHAGQRRHGDSHAVSGQHDSAGSVRRGRRRAAPALPSSDRTGHGEQLPAHGRRINTQTRPTCASITGWRAAATFFGRLSWFQDEFLPSPPADGSGTTTGTLGPQQTTAWSFASRYQRVLSPGMVNSCASATRAAT